MIDGRKIQYYFNDVGNIGTSNYGHKWKVVVSGRFNCELKSVAHLS